MRVVDASFFQVLRHSKREYAHLFVASSGGQYVRPACGQTRPVKVTKLVKRGSAPLCKDCERWL